MSEEYRHGRCPACGQIVNANPGESVPTHRAPGEHGACPGSGQTAQPA